MIKINWRCWINGPMKMTSKHSSPLLILEMSVTWIKPSILKTDQLCRKMTFEIIHKTTNEIRSGQWDSEYLNFVSKEGNVGWDEYHHWKPYDRPVVIDNVTKFDTVLSIHNPILFVDLEITLKTGEKTVVTIPLELDRHTKNHIEFKPLIGRLLFWKCSYHGSIPGREERVYQLPIGRSYEEMIDRFARIRHLVCDVCLGIDQHMCHKCSK